MGRCRLVAVEGQWPTGNVNCVAWVAMVSSMLLASPRVPRAHRWGVRAAKQTKYTCPSPISPKAERLLADRRPLMPHRRATRHTLLTTTCKSTHMHEGGREKRHPHGPHQCCRCVAVAVVVFLWGKSVLSVGMGCLCGDIGVARPPWHGLGMCTILRALCRAMHMG